MLKNGKTVLENVDFLPYGTFMIIKKGPGNIWKKWGISMWSTCGRETLGKVLALSNFFPMKNLLHSD